jgi:hypothetical protein
MIRLVMLAALLAACGSDDKEQAIDAPSTPPVDSPVTEPDAAVVVDAPSGTVDAAVGTTCGAELCTATQECCVGAGGSTCVDTGTCQTVTFACDGPEDCPGEVCCFGAGGVGGGGSECRPANQCQNNACHEMTDCEGNTPMCCPLGDTGFKACLAQCPP